MDDIEKIKQKRELSSLPDSIVKRTYNSENKDVKETRSLLRKYFGIFLTNKVLKNNLDPTSRLKNHISSKNRNYEEFYTQISAHIKNPKTIVDLGCGTNGFSYNFLNNLYENINYIGIEAAGQIVDQTNKYFKEEKISGKVYHEDLFEIKKIIEIIKNQKEPRTIFLFQVIDALESLEKDFSKKFIREISPYAEEMVISLPTKSIGGRKHFAVRRKWLTDFLEENFKVIIDFKIGLERVVIIKKK